MEEELKEMLGKRPDELEGETLKLFNAIMKIADERDELKLKCKELKEIEESHRKENGKLRERVKELEEWNEYYRKEMLSKEYIKLNYIPKSKLKDIIDRIDYDIKKTKEIILKNTNIYASYRKNDYQIVRLRAMNTKSLDIKNRLQKLLESEE